MLAPVHSLPVEILSEILDIARSSKIRSPITLTNLSLVSKHFRRVALGTARLWTLIPGSFAPPTVQTYLQRSQGAKILLECDNLTKQSFADAVIPHSRRIKSLVMHCSSASVIGEMRRILRGDTTSLQRLLIDLSPSRPSSVVLGPGPSLQSLTLYACSVPWESPRLSDLRHLELFKLQHPPDPTQLLRMLQDSPHLQHLELKEWQELGADHVQLNQPIVTLSKLSTLTMEDIPFSHLHHIVSYVRAPVCSLLELKGPAIGRVVDTMDVQVLASFLRPAITLCATLEWSINGHTESIEGGGSPEASSHCRVKIATQRDDEFPLPARRMGAILTAARLTADVTLRLESEVVTEEMRETLEINLSNLPTTKRIVVTGMAWGVPILRYVKQEGSCPQLRVLCLAPSHMDPIEEDVATAEMLLAVVRKKPSCLEELELCGDLSWNAFESVVTEARAAGLQVTCQAEETLF